MTETGGRGGPCSSEHEPEVGYAHNPNPFCRNGEPGGGLADADLPVNHGFELFLSGMRFSKSVKDRRGARHQQGSLQEVDAWDPPAFEEALAGL